MCYVYMHIIFFYSNGVQEYGLGAVCCGGGGCYLLDHRAFCV